MTRCVCYRPEVSYDRAQHASSIGIGGRITPGVKGLILANVAVFALQKLESFVGPANMEPIFGLTPSIAVWHTWWLWQLVTYMFLHSTSWLGHLLLNMLMLWMFGAEVERALGTREFVKYYFVCGIGAGLTSCLMFWDNRTIGASGAVFGVMLAYAFLFPNRQILFWYIFPMSALTFVLLCTGIELYSLLSLSDNVAHIAHLGGMLFGYLYLKRVWRIRQFLDELRWKLRRRKFRVMRRGDDRPYPFH